LVERRISWDGMVKIGVKMSFMKYVIGVTMGYHWVWGFGAMV
jgi:hypothetical protein